MTSFGFIIRVSRKARGSSAYGCVSVTLTVVLSGVCTLLSSIRGNSRFARGFFNASVRLIENFTASEVRGVPSWNLALSVRWNVHSFESADDSNLVHRLGSVGCGQPPS